jgi:hypothetical protein
MEARSHIRDTYPTPARLLGHLSEADAVIDDVEAEHRAVAHCDDADRAA